MAEEYDVGARIDLDVTRARANARNLMSDLDRLGARVRGTQSLFGEMSTRLFAIGGAYLGFRAIGGALERMTRYLYDFNAQTTQTRIGLASVFSAVENISFGQATKLAETVYGQLTQDAIESVATTKELFDIYSGIVGPIRAAGFELSKVRDITKDVVNASAAIGEDFPQAKRDVAAIVRGAAGMDVKLFQTLRSMNLIKEDAKEFNALMQKTRVEKLAAALKAAGIGGEAFGRSLPGRVSTFVDIIQQFGKAFSSPIFETFAARLGQINDYLLRNKDSIIGYLDTVGTRVSLQLESAFERAVRGARWVSDHWDEIVTKTKQVVDKMAEVAPQLAKAYVGMTVGRQVLGGGLQAAAIAGQLGLRLAGPAGAGGAARAAGGATAAGASMGGEVLVNGMFMPARQAAAMGLAGGAAAGGAETAAGAATGLGAATAGMVALGAAAVTVGSIFLGVSSNWDAASGTLMEMLRPLSKLWDVTKSLAGKLWDIVKPFARLLGIVAFGLITTVLDAVVIGFERLFTGLDALLGIVDPLFKGLDEIVSYFGGEWLDRMKDALRDEHDKIYGAARLVYSRENEVKERGPRYGMLGGMSPAETFAGKPAPKNRPSNYFDFRGSKFVMHNDFKTNDPDRILRQFQEGLVKQAERRLQSPFRPAFSR